jgi:putative redox protein
MDNKADALEARTKAFALRIIRVIRSLPSEAVARIIGNQRRGRRIRVLAGIASGCGNSIRCHVKASKIGSESVSSHFQRLKNNREKRFLINNQQSQINNSANHHTPKGIMTSARATWTEKHRFNAISDSGHSIVMDGDKTAGNSPMELVLIALCGCTGYDVVSILQKKREPFTGLEVRAEAERAADPPSVYTQIRLIYRVGGKVSRKAVEDAVNLSKTKYCSVSAMLDKTAKISTEIELEDA